MNHTRCTLLSWMVAVVGLGVIMVSGGCAGKSAADSDGEDATAANQADSLPVGDAPIVVPPVVAFPVGPAQKPSQSTYRGACRMYCASAADCGHGDADCDALCDHPESADSLSYAQVRCALASACDAKAGCVSKPVPPSGQCASLCSDLKDCGAFPNDFWGADKSLCTDACDGLMAADAEKYETLIECYQSFADDDCNLTNAGICLAVGSGSESCDATCSQLAQCGNIPGALFLTIQGCQDACTRWSAWEQLTAQTCVSSAGCERYEVCFPPNSQAPETCAPFCESLVNACPENPYLTPDVCGAFCTGLNQALPGLKMDQAAGCMDALGTCPENSVIFQCALPKPDECPAICASIESCFGTGEECEGYCPYLAAMSPNEMADLQQCLEMSPCQAAPLCFE